MDKTNMANLPREARVTDEATIGIAGMTCDNCVRKVERALRGLPGIKELSVDRQRGLVRVVYDGSMVNTPAMQGALLKSGYKPVPLPPAG